MAKEQSNAPGYITYFEDSELLEGLDDAELGKIMRAIMRYARTGEVLPLDGFAAVVFGMITQKIDRTTEKYDKKRAAAAARWSKPDAEGMHNDAEGMHNDAQAMQTEQTVTVTKTVTETYPLLQDNNNNYTCARADDPFAVTSHIDEMQEILGCSDQDRGVLERSCKQYPPEQVMRAVQWATSGGRATVMDVARILRTWKKKDEAGDAFDYSIAGGG
jgi:hypothetical protein